MCIKFCVQASEKGESYPVLEARLSGIQPDIARLYNDGKPGELMPDGKPSGIFMELALTADNHSSAKLTGCSPTTRSTSDNHYATVTRARSTTSPSARRRTTTRSLSR